MSRPARSERYSPSTPVIECGVAGPRGQQGCLLRAPGVETLVWDLENEIASARLEWLEERGGWWVAASYRDTLIDLVLRSFPSLLLLDREAGDRLLSRDGTVTRP